MAKFLVKYYETYSKSYEVEANSKEEAEEIVSEGIRNGELDLPECCENSWCETEEIEENMDFDKENMIGTDFILKNLYIGIQKESNESIVKKQTVFEGIEKYLYVRINNEASFKLTCGLFDTLKIEETEMWKAAENNTFSKTQIISMAEMLYNLTGQELEEINGVPKQFIVTNEMIYRGASAILDMEALKNFAEKINEHKFFVLPSSIHEMIIIPDDGTCNIEELNAMVPEVNQTEVAPEERLTNRAYVIEV